MEENRPCTREVQVKRIGQIAEILPPERKPRAREVESGKEKKKKKCRKVSSHFHPINGNAYVIMWMVNRRRINEVMIAKCVSFIQVDGCIFDVFK